MTRAVVPSVIQSKVQQNQVGSSPSTNLIAKQYATTHPNLQGGLPLYKPLNDQLINQSKASLDQLLTNQSINQSGITSNNQPIISLNTEPIIPLNAEQITSLYTQPITLSAMAFPSTTRLVTPSTTTNKDVIVEIERVSTHHAHVVLFINLIIPSCNPTIIHSNDQTITQLRKRKQIQFDFDFRCDTSMSIASELVKTLRLGGMSIDLPNDQPGAPATRIQQSADQAAQFISHAVEAKVAPCRTAYFEQIKQSTGQ